MPKKRSKSAYQLITSQAELRRLCERLAQSRSVALDTEFVSEHTYRPVLCLIQLAFGPQRAIVDALSIGNLTPLWEVLSEPAHATIVHAGRQEVSFSLDAVDRPPAELWDVQIAAGLVGTDYPAGYSNLVQKALGATVHKRETRTDWRRRPLSQHQLSYAMEDVDFLEPIRDQQHARLQELGRFDWFEKEMAAWLDEIRAARLRPRWRRMTGISGLSPSELAIVRELCAWRESEAERCDRPLRQVLRDDLIVELARRGSADESQIRAVRGFERRNLRNVLPQLAEAVRRGLEVPDADYPQPVRRESKSQMTLVSQFLQTALASVCREKQLASALVASTSDIRDLVAYRLKFVGKSDTPPMLARGWRAEVVGRLLDDLLAGKIAIRIKDPKSDAPLSLGDVADGSS